MGSLERSSAGHEPQAVEGRVIGCDGRGGGDVQHEIARAGEALAAARSLSPRLRAAAERTEAERRLAPELVDALAATGVFRLCVPRTFGGLEADAVTLVEVIEELARADGSAGWCAMIGATSGLVAAYLPECAAREIYAPRRAVSGGVFAPHGRALAVPGGYRLTGRWPFASGCEHCDWLMGGAVVLEDGAPRRTPRGAPETRMLLFPRSDASLHDTWSVSGLRGTGSHDMEVSDLFVPAERSVSLQDDAPRERGALYALPVFGFLAVGVCAVGLGIARAAIEALHQLAATKTPTGSRRRLAERALVQASVAQAEGALRAARAGLREALAAVRDSSPQRVEPRERALLRIAATHVARTSAQVVDAMYEAGGGSSIYATSPLQRQFRDVHVMTQHASVAPPTLELAGRVLLGLEADLSLL